MKDREATLDMKHIVACRVWLYYYNMTLFERGIINERERNLMALKIANWNGYNRSHPPRRRAPGMVAMNRAQVRLWAP